MKKLLLYCLSLTGIIPLSSNAQKTVPDSVAGQLKLGMQGFMERYHSPSLVVLIVHDKEIIYSESLGYIDLEKRIPAAIDAKYPVLSVTKTFTATMLMQLKQRGLVKLDDDVKKYVPEFTGDALLRGKSGTTLLEVATHTSGLPRNSPADISFTKQIDQWILAKAKMSTIQPATKTAFIASLKYIRNEYPKYEFLSPGDRHYSNLGYSLLGIALERAAKTDYATYVMKNICRPLKMDSSGFLLTNPDKNIITQGYFYDDSLKSFLRTPVFVPNSAMYAGGFYSTATDLAKFISFQFDKSTAANEVLSTENRAMMQTFKIAWKPSYPFNVHEGAMLGYRCEVVFNTEMKIGWVILTNTTDFDFSRINEYISRLIVPLYRTKPSQQLEDYIGIYKLDGGYDSLRIYLKNGNLYSSYLESLIPESPLVPTGDNRFKAQSNGNYNIGYDFLRDEDSKIKAVNMGQLMWVKQK
jgi:CubicO group peptidase (beta-lactamase class C family)